MAKAKSKKGKDKSKVVGRIGKQGTVPGAGPVEIEELTDACIAYRNTVDERLALQLVEADQKEHRMATVQRLLKEGRLKLNPDIPDGVEQVVYSYYDDNNKKHTVSCKRDKLTLKDKTEKSKDE